MFWYSFEDIPEDLGMPESAELAKDLFLAEE